jgi:hypothetical protein
MSTRFDRNQQALGLRLKSLLTQLENIPAESDDVATLALIIKTERTDQPYPDSVIRILQNQPYWNDLLALFPGLPEALNEHPVNAVDRLV